VSSELSRHRDGSAEEKEDVKGIERKWQRWMEGEALVESHSDQVEERQHRKHSDEHVVVYERRVAVCRVVDDVSDKGHDE